MDVIKEKNKIEEWFTFDREDLKYQWQNIYLLMVRVITLRNSSDAENFNLTILPSIDKVSGKLARKE